MTARKRASEKLCAVNRPRLQMKMRLFVWGSTSSPPGPYPFQTSAPLNFPKTEYGEKFRRLVSKRRDLQASGAIASTPSWFETRWHSASAFHENRACLHAGHTFLRGRSRSRVLRRKAT